MISRLPQYLELMRVHQWVKNGFVLFPVFFDPPHAASPGALRRVLTGVVSFCLLSSAVYVINDFADRNSDRQHPDKRLRPLAAGRVSEAEALGLAGVLMVAGFGTASVLPGSFGTVAVAYVILNVIYSYWLKHISIVDVLCISLGFVLRVEGGGALIGVWPSPWMVICTGLLALFLATAKRRDDVVKALSDGHRTSLQGYNLRFLDASIIVCLGAALVSYSIYTTDVQVRERLHTDQLYLTIPFVLGGRLRYLQIILVEERSGSPTDVLYRDRFISWTILGWIVTCWLVIYV